MLEFSNSNTVAVHVTKKCNLRCKHCYQQYTNYQDEFNYDEVCKALDVLNPDNIVLYGGECMLYPEYLLKIMDRYNDKGFIIHTNGTIYNKKILDRVDIIFLTIESFFYERSPLFYRKYSKQQWDTMQRIINTYKEKIEITHNIYPTNNDKLFFKVANLSGIPYSTYPVVMDATDFEYDEEVVRHLRVDMPILDNPKLRILEDGTITRDMRGIYNICKVEEWKEDYRQYRLPIHDKCRACKYFGKCPACNMFPHFCKDILDINNSPYFCKITEKIHEVIK